MSRNWTLCILLLSTFLSAAHASLFETAYSPTTAFYKSPESLFVSGYASQTDLLSQTRQSYTEFNFEAAVGKKTLQVQNEQILREMNVARKVQIKKSTPLYTSADLSSIPLVQLKEEQNLEIESVQGAFARVNVLGKHGYVLLTTLEIPDLDLGAWVNLIPLSLKYDASVSSKIKLQIQALTRLELIKIQNGFGLFKTGSYQGYASLADVVGRADFAELAWDNTARRWEHVLYRNGDSVIVIPNRKIDLENLTAYRGVKNRALISGDHPTLAKGTRVELVRPQAIRWTQSDVKGHGLVWWSRDLLAETKNAEVITTADLLKKNLTGLSYDSKTKKGLASAGGIYQTTDGKSWKKISYFGNDDWPVCIHPSGVWFVGTYKSTDEGKTFEPTLKFSELARILQKSNDHNRAFVHLRILDLEPLNKSYVTMKIDTGVTVAKIKSHVLTTQWSLQP
jgi:hypothetical protein